MMKRRLLSGLLTLAMLLTLLPVSALAAEGDPTITVDTSAVATSLKPGSTFYVPVEITGNNGTGFTNFDMQVEYDKSALTLTLFSMSNCLVSNMAAKDGNALTGKIAAAGVSEEYSMENNDSLSIIGDGILYKLRFTVNETAATGTYPISIRISDDGAFQCALPNATAIDINPTFTPGTVTIEGANPVTSHAVKFMNGAEPVGADITVEPGSTLTAEQIPAAPVKSGHEFLGWFSGVEGTVDANGVVTMNGSVTGVPASTETAITADTTYQALWMVNTTGAALWEDTETGQMVSVSSQGSAAINALQNMGSTARVKLFADVDCWTIDSAKSALISVPAGKSLELDLNGHSITAKTFGSWKSQVLLDNAGTLTVVSSAAAKGALMLNVIDSFGSATLSSSGSIPLLENVAIEAKGTSITAYALYLDKGGKLGSMKNCRVYSQSAEASGAMYFMTDTQVGNLENCEIVSDANPTFTVCGTVESMKDCTIKNNGTSVALAVNESNCSVGTIENCTITAAENTALQVGHLFGGTVRIGAITGGTISGTHGVVVNKANAIIDSLSATVTGTDGYALWAYNSGAIHVTGGKYKGTQGTTFDANVTDGTTGTITYVDNQVLSKGPDEEGYYSLGTGSMVKVRFYNAGYIADDAWTTADLRNATLMHIQNYLSTDTARVYSGATPTAVQDDTHTFAFANSWKTADGTTVNLNELTGEVNVYAVFDATRKANSATFNGVGYPSVTAAIAAAQDADGGTVLLTANVEETVSVPASESVVTLNLNGHTITGLSSAEHAVAVYGKLIIEDSSVEQTGAITGPTSTTAYGYSCAVRSFADSSLTVNSGTITGGTASTANGSSVGIDIRLVMNEHASVIITGGSINGGNAYYSYAAIINASDVHISGGSFKAGGNDVWTATALDVSLGGITEISGGSFEALGSGNGMALRLGGAYDYGSKLLISGGSFHGSTYGFYLYHTDEDGLVTITGGRYRSNRSDAEAVYIPEEYKPYCTFADGCALSTTPDAAGYYRVAANIAPDVTVTDENATVQVPGDIAIPAGGEVIIEAAPAEGGDTVTNTQVTLPKAVVDSIGSAGSLTVNTAAAELTFDKAALASVAETAAEVKLAVAQKTANALPQAQQAAAKTAAAILDLSLKAGKQTVSFGGGTATVKVPFTPTDGKTYGVYYIADNGTRTAVPSSHENGVMTFTASHFSVYAIDEQADYSMTVTSDTTYYNPGDTVTADIYAYATEATTFGSFQFTLDYDTEALALGSVTTDLSGQTAVNSGTLGYTISGNTGISVGPDGVKIATATFTVKEGAAGSKTITLKNPEMTKNGANQSNTPAVTGLNIELHNITVTFAAGEGVDMTQITAYAKYNAAGLYSDWQRTQPLTAPVPVAQDGYRLASPVWNPVSGDNLTYDTIAAQTFTESAAYTAQAVKTWVISFAQPTNGSLSSANSITVDAGTLLKDANLPTATASTGYTFTGWQADGTGETLNVETYAVNANVTLTALFTAQSFAYSATENNADITDLTGVSGDNKVTYGRPVTFKVQPSSSYVITDVTYTVDGDTGGTLTADENGVYTIPGNAILGAIAVEVNTLQYHTVTFRAGTGTTMTSATAYVKHSTAGLYTDTSFKTAFTVPTPTAAEGYRLAKDDTSEPLWSGTTKYTSEGIKEAALTADLTLTAQAVKQWTVTFAAGDNGTLTGTTAFTVDNGYTLTTDDIPTPAGNSGYVFDAWDTAPTSAAITGNTTFTASFKHGTYAISFPNVTGITVTPTGGVNGNQVTHGTDVTFTVSATDGQAVTGVQYKVGNEGAVTLTTASDVYTIPGSAITDAISVTVTATNVYQVTFTSGGNGVVNQTISVNAGTTLTEAQVGAVIVTPNPGYEFVKWQVDGTATEPVGYVVNSDVTFTAVFDHASYGVTVENDVTGIAATATHGTDLTFTPALAGGLVTGVSYQIAGGNGGALIASANGSYTIPGDSIIGNITITPTTVANASITFIGYDAYMAMESGKQMAVLTTAQLSENKYQLTDGTDFFWSSKYKAYVKFVANTETAATLAAKLRTGEGSATAIGYAGDLNGSGSTTAADAMIINDILHAARTAPTTDLMRFEADFNGNRVVTTNDVLAALNQAVGITN